ncbi:MAG: NADH-quinone oxidoreductase subunit NuoH [Calditrichia bacterium]
MNPTLLYLLIAVVKIVVVLGAIVLTIMVLILSERRLSGYIQDRRGPNRVGPFGLLQPIADGVKFFLKEDIIPSHVERLIYLAAPVTILVPALMTFAVIPFGDQLITYISGQQVAIKFQIADLNVGILYIFAVASLGVYGIFLGGWSSNNKYSLMGGLRSSSQMISYEIPLGLSIISVLIMTGSLRLQDVVYDQYGMWNFIRQPLAFIIFLVSSFAETNRLPFDLPEAEQELVGGYHTEYSSMKFASFFIAEYANLITSSALIVTLFFGGWNVPFGILEALNLPVIWEQVIQVLSFAVKTGFMLFVYLWVRWTLPRFRYDQLMNLGWKTMLPLALLNIILTAIGVAIFS